ncbi:acyl-CoA/acyl-ACP dehydrogenase [Siccirubricoccus sp. KC 17139]|uniref:Acyl-CoA/acyl-ACP dehydrogenase n=1 Tax=Siccirubricoccus soli TaxID=2899147 RepID=A0ABT1D8R4_9PROT|nr:acyl-CoA dehydrogenase family protein [Siccirubricoccus soli]MCO6418308.1 acyl-CoA/acyl-ACP dehydrogenase [Siccirubricoccus soli]MCP2684443.1 acyl-CoA/acyl-ACP dehydrogenase [Siccirubricoccus soli]
MSAAVQDDRAESIRMIRDSAAAVAPPGGDLKRVRELRFQDPGFDPAVFREMGEMGWIGLRVPEAAGGAGLGLGEACALAEELGAALVPEPLIPAMLSAAILAGTPRLAKLLAGEAVLLTAWQERADTLEVPGNADASRRFIPMAAGATALLLPVREGRKLALYEHPAAGLTIERTQDGGNVGSFTPDLAGATKLAEDVGPALEAALEEAALLTGAYLLGGMERAFAMTVDYLKTRSQFGRIIGTFQALQHRAADLKMQLALTRASIESAAAALDEGATGDARRAAVSRAKARAAEASLRVTRECIQLHGGIGYTDQYDVGLYLRKAMVLANQYGSASLHRKRFMAVSPEVEE